MDKAAQAPDRRRRILVVEDDLDIRLLLQMRLGEDYRVLLSSRGDSTLAMMSRERPDLILLDIHVPGQNGFELCREIRSHRLFKDIPVIFLTARRDAWSEARGRELGGDDYISKPFEFPDLLRRIQNLLRGRREP